MNILKLETIINKETDLTFINGRVGFFMIAINTLNFFMLIHGVLIPIMPPYVFLALIILNAILLVLFVLTTSSLFKKRKKKDCVSTMVEIDSESISDLKMKITSLKKVRNKRSIGIMVVPLTGIIIAVIFIVLQIVLVPVIVIYIKVAVFIIIAMVIVTVIAASNIMKKSDADTNIFMKVNHDLIEKGFDDLEVTEKLFRSIMSE